MALLSVNKAEPTLALKPRGDFTRYPKQGCQWRHKRTIVRQKHKNRFGDLFKENYMQIVMFSLTEVDLRNMIIAFIRTAAFGIIFVK